MSTILPICQPIANEIAQLEASIQALQKSLQGSAGGVKWAVLAQISALVRAKYTKQAQLDHCIQEHGGSVPLTASFNGTATFRTSDLTFHDPISLPLWFNATRTTVQILSFPPIVTNPFDTPLGSNITTITMNGGGTGVFDEVAGTMVLPLGLLFHQSIQLPGYETDSTVIFLLLTSLIPSEIGNVAGVPLDAYGRITLAGASVLAGGYLNDQKCTLVISGTVAPRP